MFEKKTWVNRQSEHPARRRLTPTGNDNEYDVARAEGVIMEDGDAFDAETMNDLEKRVAEGFSTLDPADLGADVCVQVYACVKSGTVYELTGSGAVGRCKIPAAWNSGDTWSVNGKAVPAYCGADAVDGDCIVAGRWALFTFDGQRLDFNGGGGLSASKLAQATAADTDVLTGKKYYAGGKTIKEGKMPNRGSWGATLSPGGVATIPSGFHDGNGQVAAVSLKTVTITMAISYGDWVYTLPSGTLVGVSNIAASGNSSEIASLTISGNTVRVTWSGNGVINRQITLIYY